MSKLFWQLSKTATAVIAASILVANGNVAAQTTSGEKNVLELIDQEQDSMGQINNVFQLRDLSPDHWSFDALRNLVEKYQCLSGFEDGTFRGELMLNRYQFAAALNKCLASIERLIQTSAQSNPRSEERVRLGNRELRQIKRLTEEFEAELAVLGARVDDLEGKVDFLEEHQFSTTTKLQGKVIFTLAGAFGDEQAVPSGTRATTAPPINDNITFSDRVRLNFQTSFTGKDLLLTRLQVGNFVRLDTGVTGTDMTRLEDDTVGDNNVQLDDLWYRFPVGDQTRIHIGTSSLDFDDIFNVLNPYFASNETGALSRFGRLHPLVHRGSEGTGIGVNHKISDQFKISALYLADTSLASNPSQSQGLFNGAYSTGVQLDYAPTEDLDLAFIYLHSYQPDGSVNVSGGTGSQFASAPFINPDQTSAATSTDRFGIGANWKASDRINIGGWFGLALANLETQVQDAPSDSSATIISWSINVAFPDLGGEGNVGGLIFGMPPKVTDSDLNSRVDNDSSFHIEALYRYQVNENIHVTPGLYVILNPEHNEDNGTIFVGALRTTFKF